LSWCASSSKPCPDHRRSRQRGRQRTQRPDRQPHGSSLSLLDRIHTHQYAVFPISRDSGRLALGPFRQPQMLWQNPPTAPPKDAFKGKVILLIDGKCYSPAKTSPCLSRTITVP
jgi:hypothetical protein